MLTPAGQLVRYQLIEKKRDKEVYRNRETGTKWAVEVHRKAIAEHHHVAVRAAPETRVMKR